ncbi:MAG: KH domain-containing protein [Candidatus Peregrinibacteria bacterium]|nr:KH domain-containing protein [Candidatus Peregrinibacteria bacterium]
MSQTENAIEFVRYLLEQLCEEKDTITIEASDDDRGTLLSISVASSDMGRLIGKSGQTIDAIRLLVKTIGARDNQRIYLKVLEPAEV